MSEIRQSRWVGTLLWVGAVLMMASAAIYQRSTGPTYPLRGEIVVGSEAYAYALVRSQETTDKARVALPKPGEGATATLTYRRYPTDDDFSSAPLAVEKGEEGSELAAYLPVQPAAGKIEYRVEVQTADGTVRIPSAAAEEPTIILRYKDPVPTPLLVSHVLAMFFTVLVGMRAGLGALFAPASLRVFPRISC